LFIDALEASGLSVFWDKKIPPGATWTQEIEDALAASSFVVLCLTPTTVTSSFVEAEIRHSQERVIPALFEPTGLPLVWEALIGRIQRVDLTQSQFNREDPQFSRLLSVLTGQANKPELIGTYQRPKAAQEDAAMRNLNTLERLLANKVVEPYQIREALELDDASIIRLAKEGNRKTLEWLVANNIVEVYQIQEALSLEDASPMRLAKSAPGADDNLAALPKL